MPIIFKDAVSSRDLEKGMEFDIDEDELQSSSEDEYFEDETSNSFKDEMAKIKAGQLFEEDFASLTLEELKPKMTPLTDDKLVLKALIKPGSGSEIPAKSIACMHYNAFLEGQEKPFDSTYNRRKPHRFLFNSQRLIGGLDIGVSTMRVGEFSKFWIHSSYAFGEFGCPPRIPKNANVIYEVELLNYIDSSAAVEFEEMAPEDQRNAPFEKVYSVCKVEHQAGNELFNNRKYTASISRYQRARKLLESVNVKDGEEDQKRQHLLLKLYLNLAVVYFNLKRSNRVIFHARKALEIDESNLKALFYMGRGLMLDNEFDRAKEYLRRAKRMSPYDQSINAELKNLEDRRQKSLIIDKQFCEKMFTWKKNDQNGNETTMLESPEFIQAIRERIEQFKESSDQEYRFSSAFTPTQIEVIGQIAKSCNCHFIEKIHDGQKVIKIKKSL